ncbi:MAG: alpha/beta fold hydrolase [Bacteroidales bacterium]
MKLFYRKTGNGPPLVILHGLYGSADNWFSIAKNLSPKFTVIVPDLRNHGRSPHDNLHSYKALAGDIRELSDELNLKKFFLAGHSMGGKVAMRYAIDWPESLHHLVVLDIGPNGVTSKNDPTYRFHEGILKTMASVDPGEYKSREEIENYLASSIKGQETIGFIMKNIERTGADGFRWKLNVEGLLANLPEIMGGVSSDTDELLQVTGFPVTVIRGSKSEYVTGKEFQSIASIFPAAELVTVENAGHWIHSDRPDEVERVLSALIA